MKQFHSWRHKGSSPYT